LTPLDVLHRHLDVFNIFSFVTPHEKHPHLDTALLAQMDCGANLVHGYAPLHGIEDAL
jgi:hypothetical protein